MHNPDLVELVRASPFRSELTAASLSNALSDYDDSVFANVVMYDVMYDVMDDVMDMASGDSCHKGGLGGLLGKLLGR